MTEDLIARLAGYVNEPYRQEEVLEAARKLQPPFLLREVVRESGLPRHTVHKVLSRLVKKGILTRQKAMMTAAGVLCGRDKGGAFRRMAGRRLQYLYSWTESE